MTQRTTTAARGDIEASIRAACEDGQYQRGATILIQMFGPQIRRFITARVGSHVAAHEIFSDFTLDVWRGLPGFGWRCPVRSWAYTVARNAANRYVVAPHRRAARNIALSEVPVQSHLDGDDGFTPNYLRPEVKRRFRALREQLSPTERQMLELRCDRGMPWRDLTLAVEGQIEDPSDLARATARMRKRFQLVKEKLREQLLAA